MVFVAAHNGQFGFQIFIDLATLLQSRERETDISSSNSQHEQTNKQLLPSHILNVQTRNEKTGFRQNLTILLSIKNKLFVKKEGTKDLRSHSQGSKQ